MRDRLADLGFSGVVPVFPLPETVFFPDAVLNLHVFEPRYCAMVEAARRSDGLLAVATLLPGWEKDYEGAPPFHPLATVGIIHRVRKLDGGRFDITLHGLERATLEEEFASLPYRTARAQTVPEEPLPPDDSELDEAIRRLFLVFEYERRLHREESWILLPSGSSASRETGINTICQNVHVPAFQRLRALEAAGPAERVPMARAWMSEGLDGALAARRLPRLKLEVGEEN
jgi:uncharacterized protein